MRNALIHGYESVNLQTVWNTILIDLYQRLIASGKHHSVAVVACARKLIVYANTVLERGTPWVPQH